MKRTTITTLLFLVTFFHFASAQTTFKIEVTNTLNKNRTDVPIVIKLGNLKQNQAKRVLWQSALITDTRNNNDTIPNQLDDIDQDGIADELAFTSDMKAGETKQFKIVLSKDNPAIQYKPRTFAELMLRNPKIKEKNKQDIYLQELFFNPETKDPYHIVHHHGIAFESELIALRIYFDERQTLDLYGKSNKQLELKETQFYTTQEQKLQNNYGDDILWVGNTFGFGAFRGWNGEKSTMISDVKSRGQRIIAKGPVRTIVEIVDRGWKPMGSPQRINTTIRYTLWNGHRDIQVDVLFPYELGNYTETKDLLFSTGLINVKGSKEYSNNNGLRGLWGTDWPVSLKDSVGHKKETVGMGIYIPNKYLVRELPANKDDYGFVISTSSKCLSYYLTYSSDNETFGYHSANSWFDYLSLWEEELKHPLTIKVKTSKI